MLSYARRLSPKLLEFYILEMYTLAFLSSLLVTGAKNK